TYTGSAKAAIIRTGSGTNAAYHLAQPIGSGRFIGYALGAASKFAENVSAPSIEALNEFTAVRTLDNAQLTEGGTFTTTSNAAFWGGTRRASMNASAYIEMTTTDNAVDVGAFLAVTPTAGLALVTIDGDPSLATELPTA